MKKARPLNLALQGGGSHGAYSWGVLDRLLEEDDLQIEGISGASAGAMNAVALAQGLVTGGPEGARETLERLWRKVSEMHIFSPVQRSPLDVMMGNWSLNDSPSYVAQDLLSRIASPYQINPLGINPLRAMLKSMIDFKAVKACQDVKLFISATNVRTGRAKVFEHNDITADVLAASACLPTLYQAVRIGGEYYWDGGFMGNPVIWPLIYHCTSRDVILVQTTPVTRAKVPRTAMEISNRISEISFNASLMSEMRAIAFVAKQLDEGALDPKRYKKMLMHRIHSEAKMDTLDPSSKVNAEWSFLCQMRDWGRAAAAHWLKTHKTKLGKASSLNVRKLYL